MPSQSIIAVTIALVLSSISASPTLTIHGANDTFGDFTSQKFLHADSSEKYIRTEDVHYYASGSNARRTFNTCPPPMGVSPMSARLRSTAMEPRKSRQA